MSVLLQYRFDSRAEYNSRAERRIPINQEKT